jgi:hypothetical protein
MNIAAWGEGKTLRSCMDKGAIEMQNWMTRIVDTAEKGEHSM